MKLPVVSQNSSDLNVDFVSKTVVQSANFPEVGSSAFGLKAVAQQLILSTPSSIALEVERRYKWGEPAHLITDSVFDGSQAVNTNTKNRNNILNFIIFLTIQRLSQGFTQNVGRFVGPKKRTPLSP